jgi:hypothetical protein
MAWTVSNHSVSQYLCIYEGQGLLEILCKLMELGSTCCIFIHNVLSFFALLEVVRIELCCRLHSTKFNWRSSMAGICKVYKTHLVP